MNVNSEVSSGGGENGDLAAGRTLVAETMVIVVTVVTVTVVT